MRYVERYGTIEGFGELRDVKRSSSGKYELENNDYRDKPGLKEMFHFPKLSARAKYREAMR